MPIPTQEPIYDPTKTYDDNFDNGPFGEFAVPIAYRNRARRPANKFLGLPVWTPFGIPSGPLLNAKYLAAAMTKGFDVVTYTTQRTVPFEVNDFPNVLYVDVDGDLTLEKAARPLVARTTTQRDPTQLTITNSFGNPSRGPAFWVPDLKRAIGAADKGQIVIMSVVGTIKPGFTADQYYDDFAEGAGIAADAGAQVIEVNLSCPNVASEGVLCYTPEAVSAIVRRSRVAITDRKLVAKVGYYSPEQQELLEGIVRDIAPHVDAIATINTIPAPVVDDAGNQALPGEGRLRSGMCGAGVRWAGLDMTRRLAALRDKHSLGYEIIGIGGVMTPADYHAYRDAGADAVQSATGAMWNPELAIDIKATLS